MTAALPEQPAAGPPAATVAPATEALAATLWRLALGQPQLLTAHLFGYVDLVRDGAAASMGLLRQRALLVAACWSGLLLAAVLLGMALMLWGSAAPGALARPWVLFVVPAVPLALALLALAALRRSAESPLWATLRAQARADLALVSPHGR